MQVFVGGAWPYANGSLHIGHIASLLPGDILARYFRLKGATVCYVSGSDCHGTPICVRAKREGVEPNAIAERYHQEFADCFRQLGFSYDNYGRTDSPEHKQFVQGFFRRLYDSGHIYSKQVDQVYCESCRQFLPDRFVTGTCPNCGQDARGDQCDSCGSLLDPVQLHDKKCGLCGASPEFRPTRHLFLALTSLAAQLEAYVESALGWRVNAVNLSRRYLDEGLQDRAVTRDLDWGIDVPVEGYTGKKIYVWIEAVLGYLSASRQWAEQTGHDWTELWSDGSLHYYVHGKDNIPFHSIILPGLLLATGFHLPDRILSSEYVTLEGRKISTSKNWAVWVPDLLTRFHPDTIRYFFIINGPERRDADFSWREFINSHNGELLGAFGNFVHRSLVFVQKYFGCCVPTGTCDPEVREATLSLYPAVGRAIEAGKYRDGLESIFAYIRDANKYFDSQQPWVTIKTDRQKCSDALFTCVQIIANLSNLLEPFLPFSCDRIRGLLSLVGPEWSYAELASGYGLQEPGILFERIDRGVIEQEQARLSGCLPDQDRQAGAGGELDEVTA